MTADPRPRLLVVDDEENILTSLSGVLEDQGYEVLLARDGDAALALLESERPDVVLLDIWMPGLDGIEALRRMRASHPDLPVIMMTGHGTIETAVQATKLGAFEFFEKPLSVPAVANAVKHALLERQLVVENRQLRNEQMGEDTLVGNSPAIVALREAVSREARHGGPVILVGEPGTGKKLCARVLHLGSSRRDQPFVTVTLRDDVDPEQTIFARVGSSGSSSADAPWRRASTGTLYVALAERLPERLRDRLLTARGPRVVLGYTSLPTGSAPSTVPRVDVPPLRERREDVPLLARRFVDACCREHGRPPKALDAATERALASHSWPSNVKELRNVVERLVLTVPDALIADAALPQAIRELNAVDREGPGREPSAEVTFEEAERQWERRFLESAFERAGGDLAAAAAKLGLVPELLARKLRTYGLLEPDRSTAPRQRTLARSVVLCGQGLHSGLKTGLILNPLPPDSGIVFGSIGHGDTVPAHVDCVDRTGYATGLRRGRAVAKTIEHFMATLHSHGITNLMIKIAEEVPIMDGSAVDFCQLLEDGGVVEQEAPAREIVIDRSLAVGDPGDPEGEWITIEPSPRFSVSYDLVYPHPVGHQHFDWTLEGPLSFREHIAPARTFGFLRDMEKLEEMGLGSGGRLSNFILIDDEKVVNTELRFPDELVRHKILDITGDFYLLGAFIRGRIRARKTGHGDNVALLRLIRDAYPDKASLAVS